jgi:hypothetical protein
MKTLTKILIGASVLAVAAGGVAYARGPMGCGGPGMGQGRGGMMMQGMFDRNDDVKVTREELALAAPMMGRGMGRGQMGGGWHGGPMGGWGGGPGWQYGPGWGPPGAAPQAPAR